MRKKYSFALILFVLTATSFASQITRITLAELQSKADLVVMGKVTQLVQEGNQDHVTIQVDSYLKGKSPQSIYTFTLVTRGGLKDFDPSLKKGDSGVFFLKTRKMEGKVEKAYWGSVATFPKNHFELTEEKEGSNKSDVLSTKEAEIEKKLNGTWQGVSGHWGMENPPPESRSFTFKTNRQVTFTIDKQTFSGAYRMDVSEQPYQIDFTFSYKGKLATTQTIIDFPKEDHIRIAEWDPNWRRKEFDPGIMFKKKTSKQMQNIGTTAPNADL